MEECNRKLVHANLTNTNKQRKYGLAIYDICRHAVIYEHDRKNNQMYTQFVLWSLHFVIYMLQTSRDLPSTFIGRCTALHACATAQIAKH